MEIIYIVEVNHFIRVNSFVFLIPKYHLRAEFFKFFRRHTNQICYFPPFVPDLHKPVKTILGNDCIRTKAWSSSKMNC